MVTGAIRNEGQDYTWQDAAKDLALMTHLNLRESTALTFELRDTGLNPYDSLRNLIRLVTTNSNTLSFAANLAYLIKEGTK